MESTPIQNLQRAKTHKHTYKISPEAFSLDNRQFVLYNLSLKKDYADEYDFINFRRGLTYLEEIIDFNHTEAVVARKGLRKFKDLMPQYLDIKQSHVSTSKYYSGQKHRVFKNLQSSQCDHYRIYNTEKVNGENAQISVICNKYWLIGSKNKCLIAMTEEDLDKLKNKHQYKQNILIAKAWFKLLKDKTQEEVKGIQLELSTKTLIGQYCNMDNMQHLVNYGHDAHLFFYALIQKNDRNQDCLPLSATLKFLEKYSLPKVKVEITETKSIDHTIEKLRQIVVSMNEMTMKQGGEGSVLYISGMLQEEEKNLVVCKVKTIEYRIYRKLRQKLKIYLQKYNKSYQNLLKKFTKEIGQVAREFNLNKPLNEYIQLAKKAFILCEDQNRPISRFISNRFIDFLRLIEKNVSKEKFMEIVNSNNYEAEDEGEEPTKQQVEENEKESKENGQKKEESEQTRIKQLIVLIPLTIPSTGKSTLLEIMQTLKPKFRIWSIASDQIRRELMNETMKKMKNLTQKQAFQRCGKKANEVFYSKMGEVLKNISMSKQLNHVFFVDKNHPESAIKPCIKNLQEKIAPFTNVKMVKVCVLPAYQHLLAQKGRYSYPFSASYVLSCLKRVLNRPEHLTLQGSESQRCNIVFGFANLFRNFSLNSYNLKKYFDGKIQFTLNNENCLDQEKYKDVVELFKQILLKGKPGKFDDVHPKLQEFVEILKKVEIVESPIEASAEEALVKLETMFDHFEHISIEQEKKEEKTQ